MVLDLNLPREDGLTLCRDLRAQSSLPVIMLTALDQDLDKLQGKVVRIFPDGRIPEDNPFISRDGAREEIWSYGHRNQQGAALNPWSGRLWTHEHGPRGGDEINIPEAGKNYGWPLATHGVNYSMLAIPEAKGKTLEGTEAPYQDRKSVV